MVPIRSKAEFNAAWKGYKDSGAVMSLVFHGSDHHIWTGENFLLDDIKSLPKADLSVLRILTCNGVHKDVVDNVANAFKDYQNIKKIYAMDGNVSYYPVKDISVSKTKGISPDYSKYRPRLSFHQGGYYKYASYWRPPYKRLPTGLYQVK